VKGTDGVVEDRTLPKLPRVEIPFRGVGIVGALLDPAGMEKDIFSLGEKPEEPAGGTPFSPLRALGPLGGSFDGVVEEEEEVDLWGGGGMLPVHVGVVAVMGTNYLLEEGLTA